MTRKKHEGGKAKNSRGHVTTVRLSRNGDRFHYIWAATRLLRLLDPSSGLQAVSVEGTGGMGDDDAPSAEVIDLVEYYGPDEDSIDKVIVRQFKYSTIHATKHLAVAELAPTLTKFAQWDDASSEHFSFSASVEPLFSITSNQPAAQELRDAISHVAQGLAIEPDTAEERIVGCLGLSPEQAASFCTRLSIADRQPSLAVLRPELDVATTKLAEGIDPGIAAQLIELVSRRASTEVDGPIRAADVMSAFGVVPADLRPAPSQLKRDENVVPRKAYRDLADDVVSTPGPLLITAEGGVGKSTFATVLPELLGRQAHVVIYDCFGDGTYRASDGSRHRHRDGFVQIATELAGAGLCLPILPQRGQQPSEYTKQFVARLRTAISALRAQRSEKQLVLIVDAADNAAMEADAHPGERAFVRDMLRLGSIPDGVHIVLTCRPERLALLHPPPNVETRKLGGFSQDESAEFLRTRFLDATDLQIEEFHARTSGNPRLQATALESNALDECLKALAGAHTSEGDVLQNFLSGRLDDVFDAASVNEGSALREVSKLLGVLRPSIPVSLLARLCRQNESLIRSFVADVGRGLLIHNDTVQFLDEPTETLFRNRFALDETSATRVVDALTSAASTDPYAATSLPQVLWETGRYDELLRLASSGTAIPRSTHLEQTQILHLRTKFALRAAIQLRRHADVVKLAMLAGTVGASHDRRYKLLRDNPDLAGAALNSSLLEEMLSSRVLPSEWPGSTMGSEAVMLSMSGDRRGWARSRARSAIDVLTAYSRQPSDLRGAGITTQQIAFAAHALFNVNGPEAAASYLEDWSPDQAVLDSGSLLTRSLLCHDDPVQVERLITTSQTPALALAGTAEFQRLGLLLSVDAASAAWRTVEHGQVEFEAGLSDRNGEDLLYRGLIWTSVWAVRIGHATCGQAVDLLNRYLPTEPPFGLGDRFLGPKMGMLLAYALRSELAGDELSLDDLRPPSPVNDRFDENQARRNDEELERNLKPALPWLSGWAKWGLGTLTDAARSDLIASYPRIRSRFEDGTWLRSLAAPIAAQFARTSQDHADTEAFKTILSGATKHSGAHLATAMIACLRGDERFASEVLACAGAAHDSVTGSGDELSDSVTDSIVAIARAIRAYSDAESDGYFDSAVEFASRVGEDVWNRWEAVIALAARAGEDGTTHPQLGRRLARAAELVRPFMGDHFNEGDLTAAIAAFSGPDVFAILSRWRDRDFGDLSRQLGGLSHDSDGMLRTTPEIGIAFAPLCDEIRIPKLLKQLAADGKLDLHVLRTAQHLQHRLGRSLSASDLGLSPQAFEISWDPPDAGETTETPLTTFDHDVTNAVSTFRGLIAGLDLGTRDGAVAAVTTMAGEYRRFEALIEIAFSCPETDWASVVGAFSHVGVLSPWQLGTFLDFAAKQSSHSRAFRRALDEAVRAFIMENAASFALGSNLSLDLSHVATLLGVTYGDILEMALYSIDPAEVLETSENCYRLATSAAVLLTPTEATVALEAALSHLEDALGTEPVDSTDGEAGTITKMSTAIAGFLWAALGDPRAETRWRATHAVRTILELHQLDVANALQAVAIDGLDLDFTDTRFPFYEMHATNWLLLAIDRVSLDDPDSAARLLPSVQTLSDRYPDHVSIQFLCHRIATKVGAKSAGFGTDWGNILRPAIALPRWERPPIPKPFSTAAVKTEFRFYFDTEEYLLAELTACFDADHQTVMEAVSAQILDGWHWRGETALEDDPRRSAGVYRDRETYFYKSDYPAAEDLDFYLSYHAAQTVAGRLLRSSTPYRDPENLMPDILGWIHQFDVASPDHVWISDTRRPVPTTLRGLVPRKVSAEWQFEVNAKDFEKAIQIGREWVTVWQTAESSIYETSAECNVRSALVDPRTAPSLLRSLQTTDDAMSYRLPTADDDDFTFDRDPFVLQGWIQTPYSETSADERDPLARHLHAPLPSPAPFVIEALGLRPGFSCQDWVSGTDATALVKTEAWADKDRSRDPSGPAGHRMQISRAGLDRMLRRLGMNLVVEVMIRRHIPDRRRSYGNDSDGLEYFPTYAKLLAYEPGVGWTDYLGHPCTG